ncbi:hypothetical protein FOL46_009698 [Perkinsus olseni]|uniref:CCHC-type domain-containing protein n=1 Tax=Perkinsus olseni TaxID=32597 RepID=A0A7J6KZ94_PEROL|nr:hypothetical protein FOL46_009698 [Perkinsus olseni]
MLGRRERSRSREGAVVLCANCGGRGHEASQCPSPIIEDEEGGVPSDMDVLPAVRSPGRRRGDGAVSGYEPPFHGKCANCFRFGHRARDCPNPTTCTKCFQSGHNSKECTVDQETCGRCRRIGHTAAACPNAIVCDKCGQPGHPAVWCGVVCRNCGQEGHMCLQCLQYGHMARDCPNPRVCHRCAEPGHESWQCPHPVLVSQGPLAQGRRPTVLGYPAGALYHQAAATQDAVTSRSSNAANIQCLQCLQFGHIARNCPNARACHRCGQPGHESRMCPSAGYQVMAAAAPTATAVGDPSATPQVQCLQCLGFGHMAKSCPNPRVCHRCGQPGHESRRCHLGPGPSLLAKADSPMDGVTGR